MPRTQPYLEPTEVVSIRRVHEIVSASDLDGGGPVAISGDVAAIAPRTSPSGSWALVVLADSTGSMPTYVFPRLFAVVGESLTVGATVHVHGFSNLRSEDLSSADGVVELQAIGMRLL